VGAGDKALIYLGRYLYRGVIQEKDIVACKDGNVTFHYQNSKRLLQVLHLVLKFDPNRALAWLKKRPAMVCSCCGGEMKIVKTPIPPVFLYVQSVMT
jgi:hypothetical protein